MTGDGRLEDANGIEATLNSQARRKLLKSRFSVFDGGASYAGASSDYDAVNPREREQSYHSECYACPIGKAMKGISEATQTDAVAGVLDALSELIRTGSRLLETLAARASSARFANEKETIERIPVE